MSSENTRAKVILGLRWAIGSRILIQAITWASTFLVVRILSPGDYGLVAMATLLTTYLMLVGELGFGTALVQKRIQDREALKSVFGAVIVSGGSLFLLAAFAAIFVSAHFKEPELLILSATTAIQFLIMPFLVIPSATLAIQLRYRAIAQAGVVSALAGATSTLLMASAGLGAYSLVYGVLIGAFCKAIAINIFSPFLCTPRFSLQDVRQYFKFSGTVLAERSVWFWYSEADILIVGSLLGSRTLGIYAMAKQLAAIPQERLSEVLNVVALPTFASIQHDRARIQSGFIKALRINASIAFPVFFGLAAIAEPLVHLVLGPKWVSTIPVLQLLCLSMPLRLVASMMSPVVTAIGRPDVSLRYVLWAATCVPLLIYIGCHWGLTGVALAWVVGYPIAFWGGSRGVAKAVGTTVREIAKPLLPALLIAAVMAGVVLSIQRSNMLGADNLMTLLVSILVGGVVYPALLFLFARTHYRELLSLMRDIFRQKTK